jgi:hypothetical protein
MGLENMLEMRGVQLVLKNLLQAAAPQLGEQIEQIGNVITAFKEQSNRIEANQKIIMAHLGISPNEENHGDAGRRNGSTENPHSNAGKPPGQ